METLHPNNTPFNSSPNKRFKTETLTLGPSVPSSSFSKGKAPITADDEDVHQSPANSPPQNCGICFSEEGKTVRGLIDSCDHYFCFLCIIEWSKVESRCPLCRGRFCTIRRMRRDGSFIGEGSVRIPVRDQIYDPFGEPVDPYAQAKCAVCNGTSDESLLLLCDLCDSAWHTYCVGLGATVPEGDWYCRDCALLRDEEHDSKMDDNVDNSTIPEHVHEPPSTSAPVSIFDIVREPSERKELDSGTERLLKFVCQHPTKFSSSSIASDQPNTASAGSLPGAAGNLNPPVGASDSSARTLRNCRNVRRHINVLRENWDALRTGTLSFSSTSEDSTGKGSRKSNVVATCAERSCNLQSVPSTSCSKSKEEDTLCDAIHNKESYNVNRAWKLMNIAKSMQQVDKTKSTSKIARNNVVSRQSGRKDLTYSGSGMQRPTDKVSGKLGQMSGKHQFTSVSPVAAGTSSSKYEKSFLPRLSTYTEVQTLVQADKYNDRVLSELDRVLSADFDDSSACSTSSCGPRAGASGVSCTKLQRNEISTCPVKQVGNSNTCITSNSDVQTSVQAYICRDGVRLPSHMNQGRELSISEERSGSACSTSRYEPMVGRCDASHVKLEGKEISAYPTKIGAEITRNVSKDDEAKGEIQSLVKLNLKLLSKDKRLGVDVFKEIARLSTHTILAACGFEHRKIVSYFPTLVCGHGDKILHRSTVVPSSCRECFYAFVKDVVNSIMSEKLNNAGVAR